MESLYEGIHHRGSQASTSGRLSPGPAGESWVPRRSRKQARATALIPQGRTDRAEAQHVERCQQRRGSGLVAGILQMPELALNVFALQALSSIYTQPSEAAEALPIEFVANFLDKVENLGPYGPLFFIGTVVSAEMLPLFPTQPLTIASGLLFGPLKGALCALLATFTAAVLAFQLSRRVGQSLADSAAGREVEETKSSGFLNRVEEAIDSGSFQQQVVAVTLLRLTPVVPFSASNYLLGATPLKFSAYMVGSAVGLSFWCTLFAAVGSAGREVFKSGTSLDVILDDLLGRAGDLTETAAIGMALLGLGTLGYYAYQRVGHDAQSEEESKHHKGKCKQT